MKLVYPGKKSEADACPYRLHVAGPGMAIERNDAALSIMRQISSIEAGINIIGSGLPVPGLGRIDIIADDGDGSMILGMISREMDAKEVSSAIMRAEWVSQHVELLCRLYSRDLPGRGVRIWLMAQRIIPEAEIILRRLADPQIEVFAFEGMGRGAERWLVIKRHQPLCQGKLPNSVFSNESSAAHSPRLHTVLTKDEVNDFFSSDADAAVQTNGTIRQDQ